MTNNDLPDWDRIVDLHAKRVFRVSYRILNEGTGVHSAVFSPDSKTLATGCENQTLRLKTLP